MCKLDVRTHLLILVIATVFWFLYKGILPVHCLFLLNACYLCYVGHPKKVVKFALSYIVLVILANVFAAHMALLYIVLNTFARAVPLMMVAAIIIDSNPSKLFGSYQRLHIPKSILIMVCILIRFFPVLGKEMLYIRDGIRARGVFSHWYDYLLHPLMVYECFFVPLIMRCLKLSSELGASAELRGLDAPCTRSCIYKIGFSTWDIMVLLLYTVFGAVILLGVSA